MPSIQPEGNFTPSDCDFWEEISKDTFDRMVTLLRASDKTYELVTDEHEGATYHWSAADGTGIYLCHSDGECWLGLDHSTKQ